MLKKNAVMNIDVAYSCRVNISVSGLRSDNDTTCDIFPYQTSVYLDIRTVIPVAMIYLQCDAVIIASEETILHESVLAAYQVNSVTVKNPVYHIDVLDSYSADMTEHECPARAVDEGKVLDCKVLDILLACRSNLEKHITASILGIAPMLHLLSGDDTVSSKAHIAA